MMNTDILNTSGGLLISAAGMIALALSVSGIKRKDLTLLNLGLFFVLYGLRWLTEVPAIENDVRSMIPLATPNLHSILTYLIPIPFAGFLLSILGRGLYGSIFWFFISTIVYALFGIIYDLTSTTGNLIPSINIAVLALWCLIGGINVILIQAERRTELIVLKITLYLFLLCLAYDSLVVMDLLPWKFRMEHIDILVLFAGMAYIAIRRIIWSKEISIYQSPQDHSENSGGPGIINDH